MKKKIVLSAVAVLLAASPAFGSGFRIPEQSLSAVALSNAYGAAPKSADASYFNPAAMSWLAEGMQSDASITWVHLPSITYTDNASAANNGGSSSEDFVLPNLHVVSPMYQGRWRFGFSVVYPFGLSKQWSDPYPRMTAEEFTLKTYEFNPTFSYKVSDSIAVGGGVRIIYADGKVKSHRDIAANTPFYIARDLEGDTTEYGYNLALSMKPTDKSAIAITYRSQVDLDVEGNAKLYMNIPLAPPNGTGGAAITYDGMATVTVATPDVLTVATAYTCNRTTFEFVWDRTFWGSYDKLDFNYDDSLSPFLAAFDVPLNRNWDDVNAFRFGVTHSFSDAWTVMAGFALDESPAPADTLGFELPDADGKIYSLGVRWQACERMSVGGAYLFSDKDSRSVVNGNGVNGTFDDGGAHLMTVGMQYKF